MAATTSLTARVRQALDAIDPDLGAFITVDRDGALERARLDPGGPLAGLIVAVKDIIDTQGIRTTYGAPRFDEHMPDRSADVVHQLEKAGVVIIGKTNLNQFAYGVSGYNPFYGLMRVPGSPNRTPGGSSGGSAITVAAGVCDVAVGTDTSVSRLRSAT